MKTANVCLIIMLILPIFLFLFYYNSGCEINHNESDKFDNTDTLVKNFFDALYVSQDELGCPKVTDKNFINSLIEETESYPICEMRTFRFPSLSKAKVELKFEDGKLRLYRNFLPYLGKYDAYSVLPEPKLSQEKIYQSIVKMSSVLFKDAIGDYIFSSEFESNGVDFDGKCHSPDWCVSWSREIDGIPLRYEGGGATLCEKFGWKGFTDFSVSTNYVHGKQDADKSLDANKAFAEIMKDYSGLIKTTLGDSHSSFLDSANTYEIKEAYLCYINPRFFVPFSPDKSFKKYTAILTWEIPIVLFDYDSNSRKRFFDVVSFWVDSQTKTPLGFGCSIIPEKSFFGHSRR